MKKMWIIRAVIVLLIIVAVTVVLLVQQNDTPPAADTELVSLADDCWEHVTNMNMVEQGDGTVEVTLTAPDYVSIMKLLAGESGDTITREHITKAVKSNPEMVKEYVFIASSSAEIDIKNTLMEQISYELVALTLEDIIGG